jgi:hypothetical protein
MVLDASNLETRELLLQLRELLASQCNLEVRIEVILGTKVDAKRVKAFVSMSGCSVEISDAEGRRTLLITGSVCCA